MWHQVKSSNISELSLEGSVLKVRFKSGTEYHYQNVSPETFEALLGGASVGRTFNELIKSKPVDYPCSRAA